MAAPRLDLSRPVRTVAAVCFAYEACSLAESLLAERSGRRVRVPTISAHCWNHRVLVPLVLAGLGLHLLVKPNAA